MTDPVRVLTLATLFPHATKPNFGIFVERQTAGLAQQDGFDVTVVNPIGMPPWPLSLHARYKDLRQLPLRENWRGLTVHRPRFTLLPKIGSAINPRMIAAAVIPLAKRLHAAQPFDLIDAEFFYPDGPAAMRIAAALDIPFTIKARGSDIHHHAHSRSSGAQLKEAADKAVQMFAVSEALKRDMISLGMDEAKIARHYTGIDRSKFHPRDRQAEKAKLAIEGPLMLSVGALITRKQQDLLIRALPELPGLTLMLVGSGEAAGSYQRLAADIGVADRVIFSGPVAHDDLPPLFAAADIFALTSVSEGLANVWVEALASGTPVIASNVGGAPELLRAPEAGRIVAQDPTAIAAAARELLDAPIPQEKALDQVAEFSWERNAQQLADAFRRVAHRA